MRQALLFSAMTILLLVRVAATQNSAQPPFDGSEGKKIFAAAGCAKCHDADGSKKLPDGTSLLARLAKNKDPETRLATRLKNAQERHQVFLYLQPMIERERLSPKNHGNISL